MTEENKIRQAFIETIEGYLAVNPDWKNDASYLRAEAYHKTGDKKHMAAPVLYSKAVKAWAAADYAEAIYLYQNAAHLDPGFPWSADNLAWILSTCPDARLRDGRMAILYLRWS